MFFDDLSSPKTIKTQDSISDNLIDANMCATETDQEEKSLSLQAPFEGENYIQELSTDPFTQYDGFKPSKPIKKRQKISLDSSSENSDE